MPVRLIILQTTLPSYRRSFFSEISNLLKSDFELYAGDNYFQESIETDKQILHYGIRNKYYFKKKLLWQIGVKQLSKKEGILVLELNPRILSNWWLLLIRKLKGKDTVLWGHAFPRSGKTSNTEFIRKFMRSLSSGIITYSEKQKEQLKKIHNKKPIFAAPNALYNAIDMQPITNDPYDIIFTGRFVREKKVIQLVKAFKIVQDNLPSQVRLVLIGDGPEKQELKKSIEELNLKTRVLLLDSIYNLEELKKYYSNAIVAVSPGTAGLFLVQAMSFGLPVIVSKNEKHGPEIEIIKEEINGFYYDTDNLKKLADLIKVIFENREYWITKRESISENCRSRYSVESMSEVFSNLSLINSN